VELINALIGVNGCKEERLRFLKLGVGADQPFEVREAAMDGLVDLEDPRALALLKGLSDDPDQKVRALARQSHDLLEQMLK
jgi:HEAT repeat protein